TTGGGTTKYIATPLGVDAHKAPELVARHGQSPAEHVPYEELESSITASNSLEKRFSKVTLCSGVELRTQCAGGSLGFGQCVDSHYLKILDETQRIVFNQAKVYSYGSVDGLGENPCSKLFYGGKKGDVGDSIFLSCNPSKTWKNLKNGEFFAVASFR